MTEAERLLGGRGFLPNEEFRRLYRNGRITDDDVKEALTSRRSNGEAETVLLRDDRILHSHDVFRLHLLYGIEPLDPAHLPWQVYQVRATKRFRKELPEATRALLLDKARTGLRVSLAGSRLT